jgi:serine/threonine protein kinase
LCSRNIGCDIRGDYKIFDMGLAKELKRGTCRKFHVKRRWKSSFGPKCFDTSLDISSADLLRVAPDGYECTGLTGSRRWMAPEVCLCKLYGLSSDVYSFSLLFYHVMTLEMPYHRYDLKNHMKKVVLGGERPNGNKIKASDNLKHTIIQGWHEDPRKRPSMADICDAIQEEVVGRKQDVKKNKRRSTVAGILRRSQILKDLSEMSMVREDDDEDEDGIEKNNARDSQN